MDRRCVTRGRDGRGARRSRRGSRGRGRRAARRGCPFGVKELDDLAGFPITHASRAYKDTYAGARLGRGRAAAERRGDRPGQDEFAGVRIHRVHEEPSQRHHPQPVEPGADARRFERRLVRVGLVRPDAVLHGLRRRRQHPHPRLLDGPFRDEGVVRARADGPEGHDRLGRHERPRPDGAHGARRRDLHRRRRRHARRPTRTSLPHPGYKYADRLEQLPKKLRIAWSPDLGLRRRGARRPARVPAPG